MIEALEVSLGERSYPIYIGSGLLLRSELFVERMRGRDVLVVTDETVAPLYLARLRDSLSDFHVAELILPAGEGSKTLATATRVIDALVAHRCQRDATIVALGGGVVGDIAGFAAACYQRGIAWLQVPTSLLAQVDSSVGGKTGVNHAAGKNLIGAFHQPVAVVADFDTLATLEERELRAGLAEVVKYGVISDADFFAWLENHLTQLLSGESQALMHAIRRSCEIKADIVGGDERERGRRALLNFGHSFAHAIEKVAGYGNWRHGEAVSAGMCMAAELSRRMGLLDAAGGERIAALLQAAGLPIAASGLDPAQLKAAMGLDKKQLGGRLRLVLIEALGAARVTSDFPEPLLDEVLEDATAVRPGARSAGG
ncbi:MAG: 3-dehydroquinate synthase [Gammaproteobacteria bacterium]|nr:3-dehydroquinate synthase [Gammaproteobacteria bacterium]